MATFTGWFKGLIASEQGIICPFTNGSHGKPNHQPAEHGSRTRLCAGHEAAVHRVGVSALGGPFAVGDPGHLSADGCHLWLLGSRVRGRGRRTASSRLGFLLLAQFGFVFLFEGTYFKEGETTRQPTTFFLCVFRHTHLCVSVGLDWFNRGPSMWTFGA